MTYYSHLLNLSTIKDSKETGQLTYKRTRRNLPLGKGLLTSLKSITALTSAN
jgi:hypothetical protein